MEKITLTTMCAIINDNNEVLFIDREKSWKGLALPGGHIEPNESVVECVKREILEETGLELLDVQFKGITHFYNPELEERYMVFNFKSDKFAGSLKDQCQEGHLCWLPKDGLDRFSFSEGMDLRFDLFFNTGIAEMFVEWGEKSGYKNVIKSNMA